jgi:Tfp pilus assembly protein PilO
VISFKSRAEIVSSIAILAAIGIVLATAAFMIFVPIPTAKGVASAKIKARNEIEDQIKDLKSKRAVLATSISARLWTLPPDQIGPKALESITEFARREKLTLKAFRPQKANEVNGLMQLPYLIAIEGSYPGLMRFLNDLQTAELKVATSVVQLANTDPNSDLVSATIGVVAYRSLEVAKPEPTKKINAKKEN